jgi:hypothetical protein
MFGLECLAILQNTDTTPAAINTMLSDANLLMKLKNMKLEQTDIHIK